MSQIPPPPQRPAPGTPLVDRKPADPHLLPDWAREPASVAPTPSPRTKPPHQTQAPPARAVAGEDGITQAILLTKDGVDNLQTLLDTPEGPTKTDQILELLNDVSSQQDRISERLRLVEQKQDRMLELLGRLVRTASVDPADPSKTVWGRLKG